ncbi:4-hydroxythreonine-4-phosphate dehydrogenase PdxA [Dinghuibacter silviterrae]|uniref:4-hydroxythreonine-4-phosphate dehydrogenase n=1 Tax=Dinghuibacter silviterrae TaxID=1539049 RepID=A0A4R8DSY8_9BACT|nr:4-hydroxythreonine-4-phosphate dehydrogenase PdxA [Dinghuibacter silviterrae]TDX01394.1 4-hydroxythreonine-4-phosphate dehydrogenase [Dinghuibacter silviterrae]
MNPRPILGITMGDPAGIGPEIAVKALLQPGVYARCRPLLVGDAGVIERITRHLRLPATIRPVHAVSEARYNEGTIDVLDMQTVPNKDLPWGEISAESGHASFEAVREVIALAMKGAVDATVTGPIHKKAINEAGHHFAGHTEIYAHFTHTARYGMLLVEEHLRVIHVSTHVSLRQACDLVTKERVLEVIELLDKGLRSLGIEDRRIGVAGLNPHAGDSGLFGTEDDGEILPAVKTAQERGFDVEGPVPPDTLFAKAATGYYGGVVAMYHDQGHIPFKLSGFTWNAKAGRMDSVKGVNITLGLPIIRTSVDHGTAFEIAGKGIASPDAMSLAIDAAIQLHVNKNTI